MSRPTRSRVRVWAAAFVVAWFWAVLFLLVPAAVALVGSLAVTTLVALWLRRGDLASYKAKSDDTGRTVGFEALPDSHSPVDEDEASTALHVS